MLASALALQTAAQHWLSAAARTLTPPLLRWLLGPCCSTMSITDSTGSCMCRFLIFIGVYSGIVGNQNFSRFIRYNAMQAVLLDILIV